MISDGAAILRISHLSLLPSSLFSSFPYLRTILPSPRTILFFFSLISFLLLPVLLALKKATLCLLSRLVRTTSIDYFLAFAMHKNACVFFYYDSLLLFFLNIFLSPSPSHSFSLFSLFLSRFRIHLLIFFRHALRSVSCSSSSFYFFFFFFFSSPPLRTLQSTLINELISTS